MVFLILLTEHMVTLIFTLTGTLNRIRVKISVGNIGIFDIKRAFCANKSFKSSICSGDLEFKSRLAHQRDSRKAVSFFVSRSWPKPLPSLEFLIERNPRGFFVSCKQSLSIRNYFRLFSSTPSATGLVLPGLLRFEEWMHIQPAEYVKTRI